MMTLRKRLVGRLNVEGMNIYVAICYRFSGYFVKVEIR